MPKSKHHRKKMAWSKVLKAKNTRKARAKYLESLRHKENEIILNIDTTYQNEQDPNKR
jgi:hypothetical protein